MANNRINTNERTNPYQDDILVKIAKDLTKAVEDVMEQVTLQCVSGM